LVHTLDSIKA